MIGDNDESHRQYSQFYHLEDRSLIERSSMFI